jgi:ActR/RegA family two-component response regulator
MRRREFRDVDRGSTPPREDLSRGFAADGLSSDGCPPRPAPADYDNGPSLSDTGCAANDVGEVGALRSVLIIDDQYPFVAALTRGFAESNIQAWTARCFSDAPPIMEICRPDLVISELKVGGRFLFGFLPKLTQQIGIGRFVVTTLYPSVATAVRLIRMGVAAYLTKPVSAAAVLTALSPAEEQDAAAQEDDLCWPTLDRAIWEYLSQVHALAGSMSEAARRLGIDPRSLRRMLAKYPPLR